MMHKNTVNLQAHLIYTFKFLLSTLKFIYLQGWRLLMAARGMFRPGYGRLI